MLSSLPQAKLDLLTHDSEGAALYQCLHYHDVLSRVGLLCWRYRKHDAISKWPARLDPSTSSGALEVRFPESEALSHCAPLCTVLTRKFLLVNARFRLRTS